jgi:hypothetical protein
MKTAKIILALSFILLSCIAYKHYSAIRIFPVSFTNEVVSPDGQQVVSSVFDRKKSENLVIIFYPSGKVASSFLQYDLLLNPVWGSDSKTLFFGRMDKTYNKFNEIDDDNICSISTESKSKLHTVVSKPGFALGHPSASSDGVHLAYEQRKSGFRDEHTTTIFVRDLKTQREWNMAPYRATYPAYPVWSGDGNVLAFNGTQDPSQEQQAPYLDDEKNPAITSGLIWANSKDGFVPHFLKAKFSYFAPNSDGSQFALVAGVDKQGFKHVLQVVDSSGNQVAQLKRSSVSVTLAWNSTNTAIFFLDNFYSSKDLQLCRWDIKTGQVDVLQTLPKLRGIILGYRNGTLFYSTAALNEDNSSQINQLKTD